MTIYEEAKDTAKKIRKRLKGEFPDLPKTHFKVKTSTYSGGSSVTVYWDDYPLEDDVKAVIDVYNSASFDGMQDLETVHGYIDPEDGENYSGAKYIFTRREVSAARTEKIKEAMKDIYDEEYYEEYKNDYHTVKKVDAMLGSDNQVLPKYRTDLFDAEKVIEETDINDLVEEYLDNFPYHEMSRVGTAYDLECVLGDENPKNKNTYTLHDKFGVRSYLKSELSKVTRKDVEKAVKLSRTQAEYDENKDYIFYEPMNNARYRLRIIVADAVKEYYIELVKNNYKKLLQQNKNYEGLLEKYKKHCHLYELSQTEESTTRKIMGYAFDADVIGSNGLETLELFAEKRYKQFLEQAKRIDPDNVSPDVKAVNIMVKLFDEMNEEKKNKIKRIMAKNDNEMVRLINSSNNRLKHGNNTILKYLEPKVSNGLVFYQSAFAMFVYNPKDKKFTPVYRYGTDTIEMCVGNAKKVALKYNLDRQAVTIASKLYLRGS